MQRFLISTLSTLFVFCGMFMLTTIVHAQNAPIEIQGEDYEITKTIAAHAAKSKTGQLYDETYEYALIQRVQLKNADTGQPLPDNSYILRLKNGTYFWYSEAGNILSSPLVEIGKTTSGITVLRANFAGIGDRDIVPASADNPTRFVGYSITKHGPLPGSQTSQTTANTNSAPTTATTSNNPTPTTQTTATSAPGFSSQFTKLPNPLGGAGVNTTGDAIDKLTTIVMIIAVPFVTIMIMYAGFSYITAYGNPEKIKAANKRALWTLVGTLLLFGAATIGNIIIKTVQKITTDGVSSAPATSPNQPTSPTQTTPTTPTSPTTTTTPNNTGTNQSPSSSATTPIELSFAASTIDYLTNDTIGKYAALSHTYTTTPPHNGFIVTAKYYIQKDPVTTSILVDKRTFTVAPNATVLVFTSTIPASTILAAHASIDSSINYFIEVTAPGFADTQSGIFELSQLQQTGASSQTPALGAPLPDYINTSGITFKLYLKTSGPEYKVMAYRGTKIEYDGKPTSFAAQSILIQEAKTALDLIKS
jgi:hypothetical protein